ncbi:SDR family oxidoreductase [Granulosicoccus antarcticus]|uniref:Sepiapterin reductase n=1 Tax=Granulosicoccus antarcticus IMCC3135 TaxID=1192854 RepID=A0A2Z2P1V4_9GAMM|nr:SDR family oxidoreductase [Granulosicoccus antarcticus]ASJ76541.1 Sepiapterin reductase [Granulosicoccus antarcticus IMCC3135]
MSSKGCVLITGGSRGIGRACCRALGEADYETVSLSRQAPATPLPTDTHYCVDLAELDETTRLIKTVLSNHAITGLVCNAGRGDIGSLENFSPLQIQQSITLNLISPLSIARLCLPSLRSRPRSDLVFIGSTSALQGARYGSLYSAAKFALRGVAQALSHEVAGANCHVGIVQPGMVRTDFFDQLDFEPGPDDAHALQDTDVANAVLSMVNSPDNAVINELVVQPRQHVVQKRKR